MTRERAAFGAVEIEERELLFRRFDPVELGDHADRGVLECGLLVARGVEEPVAAEWIWHEVGRDDAVTLLHDEERCAEDARVTLEPVHAGHGHRGVQRDLPHDLELAFEVVLAEHRDVGRVGRDARDERLGTLGALLVEDGVEEQRLGRHPVGGGNVELGDADAPGVGAPGRQPRFQGTTGVFEVAGKRLRACSGLGRPVDRVIVP